MKSHLHYILLHTCTTDATTISTELQLPFSTLPMDAFNNISTCGQLLQINSCNTLVETEDNNQTQRIKCFISFELHLHYELNTLLPSKVLKSYLYVSTNFLGSILLSVQTMNLKEISRSCFQVLDYSKGISKTDYPKSTNFKLRMVFSLKSSNRMRSNS